MTIREGSIELRSESGRTMEAPGVGLPLDLSPVLPFVSFRIGLSFAAAHRRPHLTCDFW
jgi:hypothetical protein